MNSSTPPADTAVNSLERVPLTVLVVDDDDRVRTVLARVLQKRGFTVLAAANGGEAIALHARLAEHIELVLMDVQMPQMSGIEVLNAIRAQAPGVRCCFMTGDLRAETRRALLASGALAVFPKPFDSVARLCQELRRHAAGVVVGGAR